MSGQSDTRGQPSATTISTVAVQTGDSRIVVAVLKSGKWVELQLAESVPNLLEIGNNADENRKLLNEHNILLAKLKGHEDDVWDLLCEADKTAEADKDHSQLYDAMAKTLGENWTALNDLLIERKRLLSLASEFFDQALEFAIRIDEAEDLLNSAQVFEDTRSLKQFFHQHQHVTKVLLTSSMALLNKSQELLNAIQAFKPTGPLVSSELIHGARSSCMKIESLLELLQDRRRQLEEQLHHRWRDLEQILRIYQWDQQVDEVIQWIRQQGEAYLQIEQLGSSLTENEQLLLEYKEFVSKAKELSCAPERLEAEADEILLTQGLTDKEQVTFRNQKLKLLCEEFWQLVEERGALLQEAHDFYNSANKGFDVLGVIETHLKHLNSQTLCLFELSKEHQSLYQAISDAVSVALHKGEMLLNKIGPQSPRASGIQEMVGYIRERERQLTGQCFAHKELALKKQELITCFEDHFDKVSIWLQTYSPIFAGKLEPGSSLSESEDVLNKHMEISDQSKEVANKIAVITDIIKQGEMLEVPEAKAFSEKVALLNAEWKILCRSLNTRIELLQAYKSFLKYAEEVEEAMQSLEDYYQSRPVEEDNEEKTRVTLEVADTKWQSVLKCFLSLQDMGFNFKSSVHMTSESLSQNMKTAVTVIDSTVDQLDKRKLSLTNQWTTCQLRLNQIKSVKKQWKKFKEQVKKTTGSLKMLEEELVPESRIELGTNLETIVNLQEKFSKAKPLLQQLNAEVEYIVKTAELLSVKGVSQKEKSERVVELLNVHQQVNKTIKEYEAVLQMAVTFHRTTQELENLMRSGDLQYPESVAVSQDINQAKAQHSHHQQKQAHVRYLYKLALTLAVDVISIVQHSKTIGASVESLQRKLDFLETDSIQWSANAERHGEKQQANLEYCTAKEEIHELKESYKDFKKKFNNLKFSYMKKNEKSRNLKAVRNQVQQVDMYTEKIQIFKRKMIQYVNKITSVLEKQTLESETNVLEGSIGELQKQVNELEKTVEDYKQNLDVTVRMQQAMEESQFWCEETSGAIVRVGKYSTECKTEEAVGILLKQFEKFVWPTVSPQETRIQHITELAVRLYGSEEGKKYVEKTVTKHNEILDSMKELCNGLRELEIKLQIKTDAAGQKSGESASKSQGTSVEKGENSISTQRSPVETGLKASYQSLDCCKQESKVETSSKATLDSTTLIKGSRELDSILVSIDHSHAFSTSRAATEDSQTVTDNITISSEREIMSVQSYTATFSQQFNVKSSHGQSLCRSAAATDSGRRVFALQLIENKAESTTHSNINSRTSLPGSAKNPRDNEMEEMPYITQILEEQQVSHSYELLNVTLDQLISDQITDSVAEDRYSRETTEPLCFGTEGSTATDRDLQNELLVDETLSVEEYECMSPDDISLPPLPDTPESNMLHSETELDEMSQLSSHSRHFGSHSTKPQMEMDWSRMTDRSDLVTPVAMADTINHSRPQASHKPEYYSSRYSNPCTGLSTTYRSESPPFIQSPLTTPAPTLVSSTLSSIVKSQTVAKSSIRDSICQVHETQLQTYDMHESVIETQESLLHEPKSNRVKNETDSNSNEFHVPTEPLTVALSVHPPTHDTRGHHKETIIREGIRGPLNNTAMRCLTGTTPSFSKLLSNVNVVEGSPVTLEIEVAGFPEPTLTWYKNGQKLTTDQRLEVSQKEGKHILFIQKVSDTDAGIYVVRAINSSGTVSSTAILQVQGNCRLRCFHIDPIDWLTCLAWLCILCVSLSLMYALFI
ncbi:coiled-coil domain-containing protein 141 [Callorhinchus milii]|uniref:coiled-coil domain-containing protein 141 n=1 Tax=Callorhinchus milii TaxID=7868 RepID=UPI001C3F9BA3|nr:coiled-coil domain-containing protein 141 [Callorhinchus milii]